MASSVTNKQAMDLKRDKVLNFAGQQNSTLRRPITVVKKRSGPLDEVLDELNRIEKASSLVSRDISTINSNHTNNQENATTMTAKPIGVISSSPSGRRRCHIKEKEKKRERWLLTRKTWRYMTDAGRKLLPDGMQHGVDNIAHIETQFQRVCASEPRFILWRRKSSFPGATKSSRKRLKILSRHRSNYAAHAQLKEHDENENIDQIIELLQSCLKICDTLKTTTLLGTKTVRPDQTASPSSRRPVKSHRFTSNKQSSSQSPENISSEKQCESELLDRLRELHKTSSVGGIQIAYEHITPALLEDKALLKKIYNILKKQQLHRILHSSEPTKTSLGRAASFSSLFNYASGYENSQKSISKFQSPKNNIYCNNSEIQNTTLKSVSPRANTSCETLTKRLRNPPKSLELDHSPRRHKASAILTNLEQTKRQKNLNSCGTQTKFIQLCELKLIAEQYELIMEHSNNISAAFEEESREKRHSVPIHSNQRKSSIDNEDVSQSVSDTIKRYLRMARKKSVHDGDANRFKSVNYDRNLRNIKAKGEINPPGIDEDNNKAVQTLDAWAVVALDFIRGIENSRNLRNAHIAWQKDLDERVRKKMEYDKSCHEKSIEHKNTHSVCKSAPASPTSPYQQHHAKEKTGRTASALLSSSSQFLSNFWHANSVEPLNSQSLKNGNVNEIYINSKNETTNMQKSKSLSNVGQFVSRKIWGSRSKCQNRQHDSQDFISHLQNWAPSDNCTWISEQGQVFQLKDTSLEKLADIEAELLMHVALEKIKELNIGMNIQLERKSQKRRIISKKRALTTSFFDIGKKDYHNGRDILFGTSLEYCLTRDRKRAGNLEPGSKYSLTSVFRSNDSNINSRVGKLNDNVRSCESLPTKSLEYGTSGASNLQNSSSISMQMSHSQFDMRTDEMDIDRILFEESKSTFKLKVPMFVISCIEYLEEHGLQKVGLFRVSTSKKRVNQLREDFDKKLNMCIPDNTCPHDVATLLKEYLRDLPEPLLCTRFYGTFLETQRIRNRRLQLEAISHLIKLLPIPHRDTLYVLLRFLGNVAAHCDDNCSTDGSIQMIGNKMDSNNLSTVFAPNILRDSTPKTVEYKEQGNMTDAINVIRIMIDHYEEIFKVSSEIIDSLYSVMLDTCPEKLNCLITNKITQLPNTQIKKPISNEIERQLLINEQPCDPAPLCDGRRQSTPVLLESMNVFSASIQISMPEESTMHAKELGVIKERKINSTSLTEPKLPASISNIGGAMLSAKTAEFERSTNKNNTCIGQQTTTGKSKILYKRQELIPSSRR